jgi:hypothetical protein
VIWNRATSLLLLLLIAGCGKQSAKESVVSRSEPILAQQFRDGSTTVIISVSETNITTIGKVQLMLDLHAPLGTEVVFPEISSSIEPFTISSRYSEPQQVLPNGKILHRQVWILVPELPGDVLFNPLEISADNKILTTDPILITVRSILPPGLENFEIKDLAAPATLLPEEEKKQRLGMLLIGTTILLILFTSVIRLFRRPKNIPLIPPHEAAVQSLENLSDDPAIRIHELNRILRAYIESRFALPMIGKTTAEILPLIKDNNFQDLVGFFERGEQIRFSNRIPDGFADEAEQIVRNFIETTKPEAPCA